jgi:hypothetical protein
MNMRIVILSEVTDLESIINLSLEATVGQTVLARMYKENM